MSRDPELITALEQSVAAQPDNVALRVHLAELLVEADRAAEALRHCAEILARVPGHGPALSILERATSSLAAPTGEERRIGPEPASAPIDPDAADSEEDEYDAFLRRVVAEASLDVERPPVTLADVGGLEDVKRRLTASFLAPMRNPELGRMFRTSSGGGLLLYGPPGCGKTFIARALAGELGARFFAVGLHDVLDMWFGNSERNIHAVFETARRHAPCVLFLDEIDALGQKRSHLTHSAGRNVVVQLLSELDGIGGDNRGVFVLGATNQPWDLDPALRRPGRLDRTVLVLPPDEPARRAILGYHLEGRLVGDVDLGRLARRTDGYSGADLRLLCDAAAERALEESLSAGTPRPITDRDLARAAGDLRPSTRPWFQAAANYVLFADDGSYDDLLAYMRTRKLL